MEPADAARGVSSANTSPSGAWRCAGFVRCTRMKYTAPTSAMKIATVHRMGEPIEDRAGDDTSADYDRTRSALHSQTLPAVAGPKRWLRVPPFAVLVEGVLDGPR